MGKWHMKKQNTPESKMFCGRKASFNGGNANFTTTMLSVFNLEPCKTCRKLYLRSQIGLKADIPIMEKERFFVTSMLPNCHLMTPHECHEANKIDKIAYLIATGAIPRDAKFIHMDKMSDIMKTKAKGQEIVWIMDEAKFGGK